MSIPMPDHDEDIPLRDWLGDKDVIAIRRKMIAEGRSGPITDKDVQALLFKDRPDILRLLGHERPDTMKLSNGEELEIPPMWSRVFGRERPDR
jgi:hypothetical protein